MDDEEIERLIAELRELLFRKGFGWAAVEAEDSLNSTATPRTRALALITAAEIVTVDLAEVELVVDDAFDNGDFRFEPDDTDQSDDEEVPNQRYHKDLEVGSPSAPGPERRELLLKLAAHRQVFTSIRSLLDGVD